MNTILYGLNDTPPEVIRFLESNFLLETGKPIRFEDWQKANVLEPVFGKLAGRRRWDTYLIGVPKKNGKSTLAACVAVYALLMDDPQPEVYGAAGDKEQAHVIFNFTKKAFERSPRLRPLVRTYRDAIERLDGAGAYRVLSSDSSGKHGLNPSCVIFDELWNQPGYDLWEALTHSPARKDPFHLITTYSGYQARAGNLLWDLYSRGIANQDPRQYTFWRSGADANLASWITPAYIEAQRRRLPDHIFRRLHLNEWSVAEGAKVFSVPADCWQGFFQDPLMGSTYVCGVDLAKVRDWTAWAIIRSEVEPKRVVDFGKLPHLDYTQQVDLLAAKIARFECPAKVKILADVSGPGQAVVELMRKRGLEVEEFKFTSESKAQIVTSLAVAFEQRALVIPQTGRTLEENRAIHDLEVELFNFEPTVLKSGNIRYEAAGAYHDDLVMSLCLAYAGATQPVRVPFIPEVLRVATPYPDDERKLWDPANDFGFRGPRTRKPSFARH